MGKTNKYGGTYINEAYKIVQQIKKIDAILPYITNVVTKARLKYTRNNLINKLRNLRIKDENGKYIPFDEGIIDDDDDDEE